LPSRVAACETPRRLARFPQPALARSFRPRRAPLRCADELLRNPQRLALPAPCKSTMILVIGGGDRRQQLSDGAVRKPAQALRQPRGAARRAFCRYNAPCLSQTSQTALCLRHPRLLQDHRTRAQQRRRPREHTPPAIQ